MHKQFVLFVELVANHTMNLKKINTGLSQSLTEAGLTEPNELQQETWSTIKSGVDCVIAAPDGEGKTTTIVINVIQRLEK